MAACFVLVLASAACLVSMCICCEVFTFVPFCIWVCSLAIPKGQYVSVLASRISSGEISLSTSLLKQSLIQSCIRESHAGTSTTDPQAGSPWGQMTIKKTPKLLLSLLLCFMLILAFFPHPQCIPVFFLLFSRYEENSWVNDLWIIVSEK